MSTGKGPSSPRTTGGVLASLPHDRLARVAREHMLWGHLIDRALMPELIIAAGAEAMEAVAIDEWMGASPNYTRRMRELMGVEGHSVADVMKVLQLDVGFVHEYMDVAYAVTDHDHGEFWLRHCGALLDAEPMGETQVVSMCHHIEDPTFDATAVATNPKVRIRPVHRPPRDPAGRTPVCHWTVEIDQANPPLGPSPITELMAGTALATVPLAAIDPADGTGLCDYRGPFRPDLRLEDLSSSALVAVAREFALQCHLIAAAGAVAMAERHGDELARSITAAQAVGVSWVGSQRLARVLGEEPPDGRLGLLADVLAVHPLWPTGVQVTVSEPDPGTLHLEVEAAPGLLDPAAPGWLGLLAGGDLSAVAAAAQGIQPRAAATFSTGATPAIGPGPDPGRLGIDIAIDARAAPAPRPRVVELLHFSSATDWTFAR